MPRAEARGSLLIAVIRSPEFKKSINQMGGYDTKDTGKVMAEF